MNSWVSCAAVACWISLAGFGAALAEQAPAVSPSAGIEVEAAPALRIVYLARENDPAYQPVAAEDGVFRPTVPEPSPGADLAIKDTRPTAQALGVAFTLEKRIVPEEAAIVDAGKGAADAGALALIADLPPEDFLAVARAVPAWFPVFNIRYPDDAFRREFCGRGVFHIVPSTSMLTDALAQFVVQKNWRKVLALHGPLPADQVMADAFARSAKKFGARMVDSKAFVYGNDPRKREQTDIGLMTASDDYDVVFLADTGGDFGRYVPWQLTRPRPVIGTEGLVASAWDPIAERFGAPQVSHRFERLAHRAMGEGDWAAWVAVRAVVEAAVRTKARSAAAVETALAHDELPIDVSKGVQSSFRPWDHQFRQAVMLHSGNAVIAYAPIEGFLHRVTPLDTLGLDQPESQCRP